jgi:hypothetical protein
MSFKVDLKVDTGFKKCDEILNEILFTYSEILNRLRDKYDYGRLRGNSFSSYSLPIVKDEYFDIEEVKKIESCKNWSEEKIYDRYSSFMEQEIEDYADQVDYSWVKDVSFHSDNYYTYVDYIPETGLEDYEEFAENLIGDYKRMLQDLTVEDLENANKFYSEERKNSRRAIELGLREPSEVEKVVMEVMEEVEEYSHVLENSIEEMLRIEDDLENEDSILSGFRYKWGENFLKFLQED